MEQINVLVVDDSLVIRGMIVNILEKDSGIRVVGAAANTADAEVVLRNNIVDVVTLDIEMPGVSGMEYLPLLARRHIPTIMLSGHTVEGSEERNAALRQGATSCFNKANAVREADVLIRQIKEAAQKKARLSPEDAAAVAAGEGAGTHASPQPAPTPDQQTSAPDPSDAGQPNDALATANRLVTKYGPAATRMLAERVGLLALQGEVKNIETFRAVAAHIERLIAATGRA